MIYYRAYARERNTKIQAAHPWGGLVGQVQPDQELTGSEIRMDIVGAWLHVVRVGNRPLNGWVYLKHVRYEVVDDSVEVPMNERIFVRILYDHEQVRYNYKPRSRADPRDQLRDDRGFPAANALMNRQFPHMSRDWQWAWARWFVLEAFGHTDYNSLTLAQKYKIRKAFGGATKTGVGMTINDKKVKHWNYVTGDQEGAEEMRVGQLGWAGNILELKRKTLIRKYGDLFYEHYCLVSSQPPDPDKINHKTHPELVHVGTISAVTQKAGKWEVIRWPQMENVGLGPLSVPLPVVSLTNTNFISQSRVEILPQGYDIYNHKVYHP